MLHIMRMQLMLKGVRAPWYEQSAAFFCQELCSHFGVSLTPLPGRQHLPQTTHSRAQSNLLCSSETVFALICWGKQQQDFISNPINLHWHLVEITRAGHHSHSAGWDIHPSLGPAGHHHRHSQTSQSSHRCVPRPCSLRSHHSLSTIVVLLSDPHKPNWNYLLWTPHGKQ